MLAVSPERRASNCRLRSARLAGTRSRLIEVLAREAAWRSAQAVSGYPQAYATLNAGTRRNVTRREIEQKLAAAERGRREAEERLRKNADRLAEVEQERAVVLGDSVLAQRAVADFDEHLARLAEELAAVELAEARTVFEQALEVRNQSFVEATKAAGQLVAALASIDEARAAVDEAHRRLRQLDHEPTPLPPEPSIFEEPWHQLAPLVEAELGRRLESEAVEAVARSMNFLLIEDLPEHLRELARQRQDAIRRSRRNR